MILEIANNAIIQCSMQSELLIKAYCTWESAPSRFQISVTTDDLFFLLSILEIANDDIQCGM